MKVLSQLPGLRIKTVEMHTGGEPLRIVPDFPFRVEGATILDKRRFFMENYDFFRKFLMFEPRGHSDMYGAVIVPSDKADFGVLFLHNEGYSTFCGHAVIALARWAVDSRRVEKAEGKGTPVNIECPAGVAEAYCDSLTGCVRFNSMPVFCYKTDVQVTVADGNTLTIDVSYGGTFYAYVKAADVGIDLDNFSAEIAKQITPEIKESVLKSLELKHPEYDDVCFLYGVVYIDDASPGEGAISKNVCVFADNQIDRCPTGSSVTARMALFYEKGLASIGTEMDFYCPVGRSTFSGKLVRETVCGNRKAVIVQVAGKAHYTGTNEFTAEKDDPTLPGFLVR